MTPHYIIACHIQHMVQEHLFKHQIRRTLHKALRNMTPLKIEVLFSCCFFSLSYSLAFSVVISSGLPPSSPQSKPIYYGLAPTRPMQTIYEFI